MAHKIIINIHHDEKTNERYNTKKIIHYDKTIYSNRQNFNLSGTFNNNNLISNDSQFKNNHLLKA